jgi:hypothetical protein
MNIEYFFFKKTFSIKKKKHFITFNYLYTFYTFYTFILILTLYFYLIYLIIMNL